MNTKKFIKTINKSSNYDCVSDKSDKYAFYIREGYENAIRIDTDMKEIKFVDITYFLACFVEEDVELLNLLADYASYKGDYWDTPKKKWFKK